MSENPEIMTRAEFDEIQRHVEALHLRIRNEESVSAQLALQHDALYIDLAEAEALLEHRDREEGTASSRLLLADAHRALDAAGMRRISGDEEPPDFAYLEISPLGRINDLAAERDRLALDLAHTEALLEEKGRDLFRTLSAQAAASYKAGYAAGYAAALVATGHAETDEEHHTRTCTRHPRELRIVMSGIAPRDAFARPADWRGSAPDPTPQENPENTTR